MGAGAGVDQGGAAPEDTLLVAIVKDPDHPDGTVWVFTAVGRPEIADGTIGVGRLQRHTANLTLGDDVGAAPFRDAARVALASIVLEVDVLNKAQTDRDDLEVEMTCLSRERTPPLMNHSEVTVTTDLEVEMTCLSRERIPSLKFTTQT